MFIHPIMSFSFLILILIISVVAILTNAYLKGKQIDSDNHLKEKELFILVKSVYRCLHKFYHPDMAVNNGQQQSAHNASLAIDLNLAFEKLNLDKDAESFKYYHQLYADLV